MKVSTRSGGLAGMVAGVGYLVQAVIGLITPRTEVLSRPSDYIRVFVFSTALVGTIFGLMGLHSFAQNRYGKAGTVGFWLAVIGTGLMTISEIATLFAGEDSLAFAFFGGMLLNLIGYILLGIMALRGKVLPLWGGLALLLGFPLSAFLPGGWILFGIVWLGVGYFLLKR